MFELTMLFGWLITAIPVIFILVMVYRFVIAVEKIADTYSHRNNK